MKYIKLFNENISNDDLKQIVSNCFADLLDDNKIHIYTSYTNNQKIEGIRIQFSDYDYISEVKKQNNLESLIIWQKENIEKQKEYLELLEDVNIGILRFKNLNPDIKISFESYEDETYIIFKSN